ncbi:MAG: WD40 repeat domain-containing protein [Chloroflexota bacterium]|nr:WD40 repeat domain-containing protein [Chloroflexota bacterium]MDQ5866871.1 WD40 repeat domain-containing protein [Chloroflexota bacterium]
MGANQSRKAGQDKRHYLVLSAELIAFAAAIITFVTVVIQFQARPTDPATASIPTAAVSTPQPVTTYGPLPHVNLATIYSSNASNLSLIWSAKANTYPATSVAFSSDGTLVASGSDDGNIYLWQVADGKQIRPFMGHESYVLGLAFAPDGRTLASASQDKTVRLWQVDAPAAIMTLTGHLSYTLSVAFSPDGQKVASSSGDKTIRLWNTKDGQGIGKPLIGHTNEVLSVAFSPDGKLLASGAADGTARIWNVEQGSLVQKFNSNKPRVPTVVFSPDGTALAGGLCEVCGGDGTVVQIWDTSTGKEIRQLSAPGGTGPEGVAYDPFGGLIVAAGGADENPSLWLWQMPGGALIGGKSIGLKDAKDKNGLIHAARNVRGIAFSPKGNAIAVVYHDGTVQIWGILSTDGP